MFVGQEALILSSIGNFSVSVLKRIHQISCDILYFLRLPWYNYSLRYLTISKSFN